MTAHLNHDPDGEPATTTEDPGWLELSAALADHACVHADRDDLVVTVAPGAGRGAPACFIPALANIELDAKHWNGANLAGTDLDDPADRARYAAAWGLLVHECAHAAHSTWTTTPTGPVGVPAPVVRAAELLEESRIEAAQVRRRPDDRTWLRASASTLILSEVTSKLGDDATMTGAEAASAAALILARADAGILNDTETAPVAKAAEQALGDSVLDALRGIWTDAHDRGDDDAEAMLELGKRWVDTLDAHGITDTALDQALAQALAQAIAEAIETVDRTVEIELPQPAANGDAGEQEDLDPAEQAAHDVFENPQSGGRTVRTRTRTPEPAERTATRTLGRVLTTAGVPERTTVKTTSAIPPGRLRMRGALARDAQTAAGATPTAEPFVRTKRSLSPAPPLKVGIACDISGSMTDYARPVASAAWILANAAKHTQVEATTATVVFGDHVEAITHPGVPPKQVTDFTANHGWEDVATAIAALDGALGLSSPGSARLLVMISDGLYWGTPREKAQQLADRLRASGCGILWLAPDHTAHPLDGVHTLVLDDPTGTARAIGKAATAALRAAT